MQRTQWNENEDDALRKVTWMARLVYLQGIRRKMDYDTGVAGRTAVISYQALSEMLDCSEHTTQPDPRATKRMLQRAFEALERAGLVEWVKPAAGQQQRGVVFRCLLADRGSSVSQEAVPKRYPSGTQQAVPDETSNGAGSEQEAVPSFVALQHAQAVPPLKSGIRKEEGGTNVPVEFASANVDNDAPTTLPVRHVFDYWRKRTEHSRAKLDDKRRSTIASRLKNGYSVDDLKAAVDGCLKSPWHQGQNGNKRKYDDIELICRNASKVDQFIALANSQNQEDQKLNDWLNSDQVIEGECSRVR